MVFPFVWSLVVYIENWFKKGGMSPSSREKVKRKKNILNDVFFVYHKNWYLNNIIDFFSYWKTATPYCEISFEIYKQLNRHIKKNTICGISNWYVAFYIRLPHDIVCLQTHDNKWYQISESRSQPNVITNRQFNSLSNKNKFIILIISILLISIQFYQTCILSHSLKRRDTCISRLTPPQKCIW